MEYVDWVLVSKSDPHLFIKCSFSKVGRSKGQGRAGWEWTEDFHQATGFAHHSRLADMIKKHKIPIGMVKLKPYTNAASEWHQRKRDVG